MDQGTAMAYAIGLIVAGLIAVERLANSRLALREQSRANLLKRVPQGGGAIGIIQWGRREVLAFRVSPEGLRIAAIPALSEAEEAACRRWVIAEAIVPLHADEDLMPECEPG